MSTRADGNGVGHGRDPGGAPEPAVDLAGAERAVSDLLRALGVDQSDANLRETPRRVAQTYKDLVSPRPFNLTSFPNDEAYDELVVAKDIPFHSLCAHHLLPFHGLAHVGYRPGKRLLGLSKLARVVDMFARGLQLQEHLSSQIASW
ncbi:MAG: GTP cyclohydrolase I, partial [Thermoplasmata archaeon]